MTQLTKRTQQPLVLRLQLPTSLYATRLLEITPSTVSAPPAPAAVIAPAGDAPPPRPNIVAADVSAPRAAPPTPARRCVSANTVWS